MAPNKEFPGMGPGPPLQYLKVVFFLLVVVSSYNERGPVMVGKVGLVVN